MRSWHFLRCLTFIFGMSTAVDAGVFHGVVECFGIPAGNNFCSQGKTVGGQDITPQGITHSPGYSGAEGVIEVKICIALGSAELIDPTQRALATWSDLVPETGQCPGMCLLVEELDPNLDAAPFHAESTILHELGHCAMGLDHPNLVFAPPGGADERETTSFTMSYGGSPLGIDAGPDGIRGSFDDEQVAATPPKSVNWFRMTDNNPIIIDNTIIDMNSYTRSVASPNLPTGHSWSANANRAVGESLGSINTQAVMYSHIGRRQKRIGLTADDVNMVKMARTGVDSLAGTRDDYVVNLQYVDDCVGADIMVELFPLGLDFSIAACNSRTDFSFLVPNPLTARHYTVVPAPGNTKLTITLNSSFPWDFGDLDVFADGFESGDTSTWSHVVTPLHPMPALHLWGRPRATSRSFLVRDQHSTGG